MSRIGGRNVVFAWVVGVICIAVVGALAVLTLPLVTTGMGLLGGGSSTQAAEEADGPDQCRDLYPEALWAALQYTPGAELTASTDAPATTAGAFVDALAPTVRFTCTWSAEIGSIATTVGEVGTDAGSIAATALPGQGFSCSDDGERVLCTRADGDLVETIESGGGHWVSTFQTAWHPEGYARRVGDAVFAAE